MKTKTGAKTFQHMLDLIVSLEKDEFVVLAGKNYCKYLLPAITNYWLPLEGEKSVDDLTFQLLFCSKMTGY